MAKAGNYVEELRLIELRCAVDWLDPRQSILEIGAGVGWQAREPSRIGPMVEAVDLAGSIYAAERVWPIREHAIHDYDGQNLPWPNHSRNAVLTSNVPARFLGSSSHVIVMRKRQLPHH